MPLKSSPEGLPHARPEFLLAEPREIGRLRQSLRDSTANRLMEQLLDGPHDTSSWTVRRRVLVRTSPTVRSVLLGFLGAPASAGIRPTDEKRLAYIRERLGDAG
jgi:hypothetical protein